MSFLSKLLFSGLAHAGLNKALENTAEELSRKNTPCFFNDGISQQEFRVITKRAGRHINRLVDLTINGPIVHGTVRSLTGLTNWDFTIDFNDYGHLTGTYWIFTENSDSQIPYLLANQIQTDIINFPYCVNDSFEDEIDEEERIEEQLEYGANYQIPQAYCPYCGKKSTCTNAKFCSYCGKHF